MEDESCHLGINQTFQLAVGAIAGASVALGDLTLGPELETSTAIFTATFGTCAVAATDATTTSASPTITARGEIAKRETTILSTEVAVTAVGCESAGLLNCPVSLQTMTVYTTTLSLTTEINGGDQNPTFPATTQNTVVTAIPFGSQAKRLPSTTGLPKAFTAQPSSDPENPFGTGDHGSTGSSGSDGNGAGHRDNKNPIIIGVTVGLGVPVLAGLVGMFMYVIFSLSPILDQDQNTYRVLSNPPNIRDMVISLLMDRFDIVSFADGILSVPRRRKLSSRRTIQVQRRRLLAMHKPLAKEVMPKRALRQSSLRRGTEEYNIICASLGWALNCITLRGYSLIVCYEHWNARRECGAPSTTSLVGLGSLARYRASSHLFSLATSSSYRLVLPHFA